MFSMVVIFPGRPIFSADLPIIFPGSSANKPRAATQPSVIAWQLGVGMAAVTTDQKLAQPLGIVFLWRCGSQIANILLADFAV
jgi:hypothetical protein